MNTFSYWANSVHVTHRALCSGSYYEVAHVIDGDPEEEEVKEHRQEVVEPGFEPRSLLLHPSLPVLFLKFLGPERVYLPPGEQSSGLSVQLLQNMSHLFSQFTTQTKHFVLVQQVIRLLL